MDNDKVTVKNSKRPRSKSSKSEENILTSQIVNPESTNEREKMIATAAYFRAERRGFSGNEADALQDWLEAEREVNSKLNNFGMVDSTLQFPMAEELRT